jgi:hypothetical protein
MQFAEVKESSIKIIHHSTSSVIEIKTVNNNNESTWLDYSEFQDLIKAIEKVKEIEKF